MTVPIIHPQMLSRLPGFFAAQVTIQGKSVVRDGYGQEIETWTDVSGWEEIKAAKAPLTANERQALRYTATDRVWHLLLAGAYPEITTSHRAAADTEVFDIDAVETDQTGSVTRLRVRQITI